MALIGRIIAAANEEPCLDTRHPIRAGSRSCIVSGALPAGEYLSSLSAINIGRTAGRTIGQRIDVAASIRGLVQREMMPREWQA